VVCGKIALVKCLWTFSIFSISHLKWGLCTMDENSRRGRTQNALHNNRGSRETKHFKWVWPPTTQVYWKKLWSFTRTKPNRSSPTFAWVFLSWMHTPTENLVKSDEWYSESKQIVHIFITRKYRQSNRHAYPRGVHFIPLWPLTFWPLGRCVPSDCYRVYQVWCW